MAVPFSTYMVFFSCQVEASPRQMQDWRAIFARNVRRLRQQKGMTQEELAFEAEIDLTYMGGASSGAAEILAC